MAPNIKDLCRLCAKKEDFFKDLMDENNKNVLNMIQELIQISVTEHDDLPTQICLNCEEKMVSFQLFVLECFKVQETLKNIFVKSSEQYDIKLEENDPDLNPEIKLEVKNELTADDLVNQINNDESITGFEIENYSDSDDTKDNGFADGRNSDDDLSDVTLATLKESKRKQNSKYRSLTKDQKTSLNNILMKSHLFIRDFVSLKCSVCNATKKTWNALTLHYVRYHKGKPLLFCICGFVIRSKSALYKHVAKHKEESQKLKKKNQIVEEQNNEYTNLNVTDFVDFMCTKCEKKHKSWYGLKSHCEKEHDISPVVKCVCGISLKSKSTLYKHIQNHKNPNMICCDKCPRTTKTWSAMTKHKLRHIPKSERKFACSSCDKVCTTKESLKSHMRSHIPIKDRKIYQCELCDQRFTTPSSASSHKRVVHDKVKGYVCDLCGYACGTNGELRQHRAIHSEEKPYQCVKCSKKFKTYSNLKTHMDTHEDTSYACYVCNRVLNSRRTLRKHLLVHEDRCNHICSYCNKAFKRRQTLKVHMYTHTGDKPLTCKWCDERFSYASSLRSHRLRCHPDKMTNTVQYCAYDINMQEGYNKNDPAHAKSDVEAI